MKRQNMLPSVMDYRERARRRLPRLAFDYLEGGAEDGLTMLEILHTELQTTLRLLGCPDVNALDGSFVRSQGRQP